MVQGHYVSQIDEAQFASTISQGVVLVDFFAPWCGPCRMIAPILEQIAGELQGKLKVCKINTDEAPAIATQYEIMSIPTLILFKNGQEVKRVVGLKDAPSLRALIEPNL